MKAKLEYWELGRYKAKGETTIEYKTDFQLIKGCLKEFQKHLMSTDIGFEEGKVDAGGRIVGQYKLTELETGKEL